MDYMAMAIWIIYW